MNNAFRWQLGLHYFSGAEILTFPDAHIECSPGWLQYLLYEVKKNRYVLIKNEL